jgi:hypothetical protein
MNMLFDKPLASITESDLQTLIDGQMAERKDLEYKQSLPKIADKDNDKKHGKSPDDEKREFLADVSSLANTIGGYLIFGIKEQDGFPIELCGIQVENVDAEKLRLESILQEGLSPRIPGIEVGKIALSSKEDSILILRIPRSFLAPHRVIYKRYGHFYARNSAGKYSMDVPELRTAFTLSSTITERIRDFRAERLSRISVGYETPAPLDPQLGKIVLHLVPFNAFGFEKYIDFTPAWNVGNWRLLQPFTLQSRVNADNVRYNFDGIASVVTLSSPANLSPSAYTQIFRNGSIEIVDESILLNEYNKHNFQGATYERQIVKALQDYKDLLSLLGIELPIFIMLSFLHVKGYAITHSQYYANTYGGRKEIDRNNLIVSEIMVEDLNVDLGQLMKPLFDSIWNAIGIPSSPNFNDEGKFEPPVF